MRIVAFLIAALLSVCICRSAAAGAADNVRTAKRVFLDTMAAGRFDQPNEIYGPGFVAHGASRDYTLEQDMADIRAWRSAMPDLRVTLQRTVAAGDLVAVHWKLEGTMDGKQIRAKLRLGEKANFRLLNRGFHWINEYPFNR